MQSRNAKGGRKRYRDKRNCLEDDDMVDYEMLAALEELFERRLNDELERLDGMLDEMNERALRMEEDMEQVKDIDVDDSIFYRQNVLKQCFADLTAEYLEQEEELTRMLVSFNLVKYRAGFPIL